MVTEVSPLQAKKAPSSIEVTLLGMLVAEHPAIKVLVDFSIMALQSARESYFVLSASTVMEVSLEQPEKT